MQGGVAKPNPGLAASVVNAARAYAGSSSAGTFIGISSFVFDKDKASFKVNIALQATKDTWLRVDGMNSMQNNIIYDPALSDDKRQLVNVSKIDSGSSSLVLSAGGKNSLTLNNDGSISMSSSNKIGIASELGISINSKDDINLNTPKLMRINAETGTSGAVQLGTQSGTKGDANVIVNDLKIHSMNDKNLTDLLWLADSATFSNKNGSNTNTYNCFSFTTGSKGHAMITAYIDVDFWFMCNDRDSNYWSLGIVNTNYRSSWLKVSTQSYPFCSDADTKHGLAHTVVFYDYVGKPNTTITDLCVSTYQTQPPVWRNGGWSYYAY
jgi:hypothetical protein